jgi:hypothetical protein
VTLGGLWNSRQALSLLQKRSPSKTKGRFDAKPFHKGVERNGETLVALGNLGQTRLGNFSPIILSAKTQRYQKVPAVSAETFNTFVERLASTRPFHIGPILKDVLARQRGVLQDQKSDRISKERAQDQRLFPARPFQRAGCREV